jgi:tetratricopeptide (TPR) repeat protein
MQNRNGATDTLKEMLTSRKQLLGELPDSPESLSIRIELLNNLGYLYWTLEDDLQASVILTSAAELARHEDFHNIRIQILNGLAILAYERKNYQEAFNIYTELVNKNPKNALLRVNLAVVLSALGKNHLAVSQIGRALKLDPENFEILYIAGYINFTLGKLDIAADFLGKSIQFAPMVGDLYEMLGICYKEMGLLNDARSQLSLAVNLDGNRVIYSKICEEALFGNAVDAAAKLKNFVTSGKMTRQNIVCDPNLNAVFDKGLLQYIID